MPSFDEANPSIGVQRWIDNIWSGDLDSPYIGDEWEFAPTGGRETLVGVVWHLYPYNSENAGCDTVISLNVGDQNFCVPTSNLVRCIRKCVLPSIGDEWEFAPAGGHETLVGVVWRFHQENPKNAGHGPGFSLNVGDQNYYVPISELIRCIRKGNG